MCNPQRLRRLLPGPRGDPTAAPVPQCCHRGVYAPLHVRFATGWARGRPFESAGDGDLPAPGNVACLTCRNSVPLSTRWPTGRVRQGTIMGTCLRSGNGILAMSCRLCTAMSSATSLRSRRTNGQRSRQVQFRPLLHRHEHPTAGRALSDALQAWMRSQRKLRKHADSASWTG